MEHDTYILMNKEKEALAFNLHEYSLKVLDNKYLPFSLRDAIKTTEVKDFEAMKQNMHCVEALRDFLCSRLLNLSRSGAKELLRSANLPQTSKTADRLKIAFACRGLCMTDHFWLKKENEDIRYQDVNLKKIPLSARSYSVAILQKICNATLGELTADLSSIGRYPKFWERKNDRVYLWKTDKTEDFLHTRAELEASEILAATDIPHVEYEGKEKDGYLFAVSECFVNDAVYLVPAGDMWEYFARNGKAQKLQRLYPSDFANMVCMDYILANTDRHFENFGFLAQADTNEIICMAPLYDHNNALIAEDIDGLIYEPCDMPFKQAVSEYAPLSTFTIDESVLPEKCRRRLEAVMKMR